MSFNVHRRDGRTSILQVAHTLCRLLTKFTPIITVLYPEQTELIELLEAANVACDALEIALKAFETPGI